MNPDWPLYAACIAAVLLGVFLTFRKQRDEEARVVQPWIFWSLGISAAIFVVLGLEAYRAGDAWVGPRTVKKMIGPLFGYVLLLQIVLVISGVILGVSRLFIIARGARKDLR